MIGTDNNAKRAPTTARTYRLVVVVAVVLALATLEPLVAVADVAPVWTDAELLRFADVVVTGEVSDVTARWDDAVAGIYTYVTVRVDEVIKGRVNRRRITLKQLGGSARGQTLHVAGQATFGVGERVVLFLEVRPRDRTLYTSAHWQGKWRIQRDPSSGDERAIRSVPDASARSAAAAEARPLPRFLRDLRRLAAATEETASPPKIRLAPPELRQSSVGRTDVSDPFSLFEVRWHEADSGGVITVDVEAAGQPGLAGGGFGEIASMRGQWNGAGSTLVLGGGGGVAANCFGSPRGDGRIRITFMDPCGEMSNSGGTLAIGGGWSGSTAKVVNGTSFTNFTTGTIVNNDSAVALSLLTDSNCFSAIQLHELGHAIGLGHSGDPSAIMFPSISGGCSGQSAGLGGDDVSGVLFVYPPAGGGGGGGGGGDESDPVPDAPQGAAASVAGAVVTIVWTPAGTGGAATSFVIEIGTSPGAADIANADIGNTNTTAVTLAGGTYYARVRAINDAGASDPSNEVVFVIGGGTGSGDVPNAPTGMGGTVDGATVFLFWSAPPTLSTGQEAGVATSYILEAGSATGLSDLANTNVGNVTSISVLDVPDNTYFVRVRAANESGPGPTSNETTVIVGAGGGGNCTAAPGAPSGASATVSGSTVTVVWTAPGGGNAPTSYIVEAGSGPGLSDLANSDLGSASTTLVARGVGPGTYFVRLRPVNGCGTGPTSNEIVVNVQ